MSDKVLRQFGNWVIIDSGWIDRVEPIAPYAIELDRIFSAGALTEWLAQLGDKTWFTPEELGNFVKAVDWAIGLRVLSRGPVDKGHWRRYRASREQMAEIVKPLAEKFHG